MSCSAARAFQVFTEEFGEWWPIHDYSIGRERTEKAVFEGWEGGQIYEVIEGGEEAPWGRVLVWNLRPDSSWNGKRTPKLPDRRT